MSTLVSRLTRLWAELGVSGDYDEDIVDILLEAAEEIQRLQDNLAWVRSELDEMRR